MNRRWASVLIAVAAIVLVVAAVLLLRAPARLPSSAAPETAGPAEPPPSATAPAARVASAERWSARLYYPAANDRLMPEERELAVGESPRERAAAALAALLATAPSAPRVPLFASAVEVGSVLLLADGTLYADLRSADADPPSSGSTVEMLRVYALVHTVLRNVPEAERVVLLWNGRQRPSFAGHVDTARPLRARSQLESSPPGPAPAAPPAGAP